MKGLFEKFLPFRDKSTAWLAGYRPYLLIAIIGLALYGRTIFFDFSYLDDTTLILDNYPVIGDMRNIGAVFSSDVFFSTAKSYYRPLLNLSFMIDAAIGGIEPAIFHLTNVLLHILAASLVFLVFRKFGRERLVAFFFALLFLVHPALSQAVAWIPGRNDTLLAVFVLAAWISFLNFSERPRLWTYIGYLFFFWLALLTKETAVFLPILAVIYFLAVHPLRVNRHDRWLLVIGSGAVIFLWALMRSFALGAGSAGFSGAIRSVWENGGALLLYIGKLAWPYDLSVFPILADSSLVYGAFSLAVLVAAVWFSRRRRGGYLLLGAAWFLLFLLPSFVRLNGQPDFLEHRAYLSAVGFLIILGEIGWIAKKESWRGTLPWAAAVIIVMLAVFSFRHIGNFRNRQIFWQAAVAKSPHSPLVQRNRGVMYYLDGDWEAALEHYRAALSLDPTEPMVHNNIGLIHLERGEYEEAEREFHQELSVNPGYDKALFNLGESYHRRGRDGEAISFWEAAFAANPANQEAYSRLLIWKNPIQ